MDKISRQDLIDRIAFGDDIQFAVRGKEYTILGWWDGGPLISEANKDTEAKVFKDASDLVDHFLLDGIPLANLISEIIITF